LVLKTERAHLHNAQFAPTLRTSRQVERSIEMRPERPVLTRSLHSELHKNGRIGVVLVGLFAVGVAGLCPEIQWQTTRTCVTGE